MLDEVLTPEERAVVARARAFAERHVAPNAARWEWERRYPLEGRALSRPILYRWFRSCKCCLNT